MVGVLVIATFSLSPIGGDEDRFLYTPKPEVLMASPPSPNPDILIKSLLLAIYRSFLLKIEAVNFESAKVC